MVFGYIQACYPPPSGTDVQRRRNPQPLQETGPASPSPELWHGIEFLKRRCERVRQAPHGSGFKLLVLRSEIEFVDAPRQVFRNPQISLNECPVDRQLCRCCTQLNGGLDDYKVKPILPAEPFTVIDRLSPGIGTPSIETWPATRSRFPLGGYNAPALRFTCTNQLLTRRKQKGNRAAGHVLSELNPP
jgi:hypothetical protein